MPNLPDWAPALGPPLFGARIRSTPQDFIVAEQLDIAFSGDGEHDWLRVEKTGANTQWLQEQLAQHAGIKSRDVGYGGLKDRNAVTQQWFSVRRATGAGTSWSDFDVEGVRIVDQQRHARKLRHGAHRGNSFRIALRCESVCSHQEAIAQRLALIESSGVPNYFGEQRFGRDAANLDLARSLFNGRRMTRNKRSIALSATRSFLFNEILAARVRRASWDRILPGEVANLDGTGSVFSVDTVDDDLLRRCSEHDIHPTATLWGRNAPRATGAVADLENSALEDHADLREGLVRLGVEAASRPLRVRVGKLEWSIEGDALWLAFELPKGAFATTVLRELVVLQ